MAQIAVLDRAGLDELISVLTAEGYTVIGPTVSQQVVGYAAIDSTADLPVGIGDEQAPGSYRLAVREDGALFGYVVGPHSPRALLHPPQAEVWAGERTADGFVTIDPGPAPRYAFFGIRPCDVAAIGIQDRVFIGDESYRDDGYSANRAGVFVLVANCTRPGESCFCASMGTGPGAADGFDLALTEVAGPDLDDPNSGRYLVEVGTEAGGRILAAVASRREAADGDVAAARALVADAADHMGRSLETDGIRELLHANLENPHWEDVADRCLGCTNCTMVCPTCFCSTIDDGLSLDGSTARRTRRWDSCFTLEFSYIHGGSIRQTAESRYRQWLTHKLASWIDQFGTSGCVGCGRCITWCPVGIDITAEVDAIRASDVRRLARNVPTAGVMR